MKRNFKKLELGPNEEKSLKYYTFVYICPVAYIQF